jgi:hypothetical protein
MTDLALAGSPPLTLTRFDHVPEALLTAPARDLGRHLRGPSLIRIPGRRAEPLLVTILLHGNEDTGLGAVQAVLRRHRGALLPRTLYVLVGNIEAATAGVRTLPGQIDYNRCWPGTPDPKTPEARLMHEVTDIVVAEKPFASIDIHNNTGNNPHYACINRLDESFLHLARLFGHTVIYFEKPLGVQSAALAPHCPSITIECGRPGVPAGTAHAAELIEAALSLSHFPEHPVPEGDVDILQTFAILKVPEEASFSFDGAPADILLRPDLDHLNFSELEPGAAFGRLGNGAARRLLVAPGAEQDVGGDLDSYLCYEGGDIRLARPAVPAMLTLDPNAVRLDCLGYLMHRIGRDGRPVGAERAD